MINRAVGMHRPFLFWISC